MKNKRKLGQAIIEYVLLLIIPVLLLSVLPNLNKTVELTLNTVGVDLMEEEGQTPDTPAPTCDDEEICSPKILYPPVASMELPDNKDCNEKGVYRKGASIRIQDLSYDTDPDNSGTIDHLEWTVEKKAPSGAVVEECSTTVKNETLKLSRQFGGSSESTGLTIDMNGYGGITDYALCVRDPGTFTVTLKAFDNDGLLSSNVAIKTFEIRDLKPSIRLEVNVADGGTTIDGSAMKNIYSQSLSNTCAFDPKLVKGVNQSPQLDSNAQHEFTYRNVTYNYTEVCPKDTAIGRNGQVVFKLIENEGIGTGDKAFLTDPDFTATNYNGDVKGEGTPEGAENSLYGFDRHGFTYQSRFIQSSALIPEDINENNSQIITFKDGASEYTKEFENPGIYMFDAQVYDENLISSQTYGVQNKDNYKPDVGIAIKVLSPNDKNYAEKCGTPDAETITCPKPVYIIGITRTIQGSNEKYGPFYFTFGQVGSVNTSDLKSIKDENGNKINVITDITELKNKLGGIDIALVPYISNGIKIPVFRPTTNDHLDIKGLTYFPKNEGSYDETDCPAAGTSRYWATSNGWNNSFDFNNTLIGKPDALWSNGENVGDNWFEIKRPYDENATEDLYYNINNVTSISKGMELKLGDEIIDHVELIYGQARNEAAEVDSETLGTDIIASPFTGSNKGQISTSKNYIEPLSNVKSQYYSKISGNDITYKNSYFRSNGQLIAIAPKLQSCPLHNQRPIPVFSYITTTDTIRTLDTSINGVSGLNTSDITWSIDTKNPPNGMFCTKEGCTVSITANDSVCGPDAENCTIKAIRWKFSPYTHEPYQGENDEDALTQATPINPNSRLNRYFPLTNKIMEETSDMPYLKYDNWFYPIAKTNRFTTINEPTTVSDSYDKFYNALATNNNIKGSYIYYGAYGSSTELATEQGVNRSEVPTFDFVKKDSNMTMDQLRQTATVAPNGNTIYTDADIPNLPDGYETTNGLFLEAGSTYTYTIEIIDSQGCATSKTLTINISDSSKEPVAYCNFLPVYDDHVIDFANRTQIEQDKTNLRNYQYYGGLMVQGRANDGIQSIFYNGDNIEEASTAQLVLYTSPLYMYEDFSDYGLHRDKSMGKEGLISNLNTIDSRSFIVQYTPDSVPTQADIQATQYNPRVGQVATKGSLNGILNAKYSRIYDGASQEESEQVFNNAASDTSIVWKLYKAELPYHDADTLEEYKSQFVEIEGEEETVMGHNFEKVSDEPIATETTKSIDVSPDFSAYLTQAGYYIVEMEISYNKDGERLTSQPTPCKLKVTSPTLDFKCPWGETIEELRSNALEIKMNSDGSIEPSENIYEPLLAEDANFTLNNKNKNINNFEFTFDISKDYNDLDKIERQTPTYKDVALIDFDKDTLNETWQAAKKYGFDWDLLETSTVCDSNVENNKDKDCQNFADWAESVIAPMYSVTGVKDIINNSDTLNPLTIGSETMTLQGWLVRERLSRDKNSVNDPIYLYSDIFTEEEKQNDRELLSKEMSGEQQEVFDTLLRSLNWAGIFPTLQDLSTYKYKIANSLLVSDINSFSFEYIQPGIIQSPLNIIVDNPDENTWFSKYTGLTGSSTSLQQVSKPETTIRKGKSEFSNVYGSIGKNITTPFYGKYEAIKRFETLNYSQNSNRKLISNINNKNNYITVGTIRNNTPVNTESRTKLGSYKHSYLTPFSVFLNNVGYANESGISIQPIDFGTLSNIDANMTNISNLKLKFNNMPYSLSPNADFLTSTNKYEYEVDRNTLNGITWEHRYQMGAYFDSISDSPKPSAITYIRINSADTTDVLKTSELAKDGKIVNSYSKLCPIMVEMKTPNAITYSSCNIGYNNSSTNTAYSPYNLQPNSTTKEITENTNKVGLFKDDYGTTYTAEQYNAYASGSYTEKSQIDSILAPKIYDSTKHSGDTKYNMSDLKLDIESEMNFIEQNKNDNLYKAVYRFYYNDPNNFITDENGQEIKIEIIYDLAGANKENTKTDAGIREIARSALQQFKDQWYLSASETIEKYGEPLEGITRYGKYFSTTTSEINPDSNTYKFEFNKFHYQVDYYKSNIDFVSGNHSQTCNFYVANELPSPTGNNKDFVLEIGSWNYRVQFPNVTANGYSSWNPKYNTFYHWDRTYDLNNYYANRGTQYQFKQLDTPNQACRWKSAPMYGSNSRENKAGYSAFVDRDTKWMWTAETRVFGRTTDSSNVDDNGGCIPAGSTGTYYGMTEKHEAERVGILSPYSLFKDVSANDLQDTHAGFYSVSLYLLPSAGLSYDEVYNMCYKRDYVDGKVVYDHAIKVSNGTTIGEPSNTYWCHGSTMYALTNRYHQIPGLSGTNVTEIIMNNNGNVAAESHDSGLYTAVNEQVNACYGKPC